MGKEQTRLDEVQRTTVENALKKTSGNRTKAAKILGISVRTVRNYIKKYDLTKKFPHARGRQK